jgi:hypothetical protein
MPDAWCSRWRAEGKRNGNYNTAPLDGNDRTLEAHFTEGGQATIYKAGDYYFETGNLAHTAENKTNLPLRVLVVDILPKDWMGTAVIPPKAQ